MVYCSMMEVVCDLECYGKFVCIKEEVDFNLEIVSIYCCIYDVEGFVLFFENVKGSFFFVLFNIYGIFEWMEFLFCYIIDKV